MLDHLCYIIRGNAVRKRAWLWKNVEVRGGTWRGVDVRGAALQGIAGYCYPLSSHIALPPLLPYSVTPSSPLKHHPQSDTDRRKRVQRKAPDAQTSSLWTTLAFYPDSLIALQPVMADYLGHRALES